MPEPTQRPHNPTDRGVVPGEDVQPPLQSNRRTGAFPENDDLRDSDNALRAAKLDRALRARDRQISLAAEAANIGFWSRDCEREDFWSSDKWRALFGFTSSESLTVDTFLQRLHPDDREPTSQTLRNASQ